MYLDVHGLAFETSIYNRKDQSGIPRIPGMPVVPVSTTRVVARHSQQHQQSLVHNFIVWRYADTCVNKPRLSRNTRSVVQLSRSPRQCEPQTLHTDNAFLGITLHIKETLCLQ